MNLVSMIVPMYNEELSIQSCIQTLKAQTNQSFDVIFVDDGSSDNTLLNLTKTLKSGVQFSYKIIEQKNKGAAAARREGVNHASTEFIMIFDCDDKLSNDLVNEIYKKYNDYVDVDIIMPDMCVQRENSEWSNFIFYTLDIEMEPWDCIKNSLDGWYIHGCFAIRKFIIDKSYRDYEQYNKNNENYINNDEVITRLNFKNSKKIVRSSAKYYYCYNILSTTKKINEKKYLTIKNALILDMIYSDNTEIESSVKNELIAVIWANSRYMHQYKAEFNNIAEWEKVIGESIVKLNYLELFSKINLKKKIQLTILKLINLF